VISGPLSSRNGASSGCGWEERPPIWRVAANILNKQSRTTEKGGPPARELGEVVTIPHRKDIPGYEMFFAPDRDMWRVWGRGEVCTGFWWGSLREGDYWGDPDVDGRIILTH
jgi:hypothetical protein